MKKNNVIKRRFKFIPCKNFYIYLFILLCAAIFTQALRSKLSSILYVFLGLIPLINILYVFINSASVTIYLGSGQETVGRLTPVDVTLKIVNGSIFPALYVEADIYIPIDGEIKCRRKLFSLVPFGWYDISEQLVFAYRGEYDIGISDIYVYDFFRFFRLRTEVNSYTSIYVLPRKLSIKLIGKSAPSDLSITISDKTLGNEHAEAGNIRDYLNGDSLKDIQWKLSAKSDDKLLVREYTANSSDNIYVICDLEGIGSEKLSDAYNFSNDVNNYIINNTVETVIAISSTLLSSGRSCCVLWYDNDVSINFINNEAKFNELYSNLTSASVTQHEIFMTQLRNTISDIRNATVIFVTGRLDNDTISGISAIAELYSASGSQNAVSIYFINPSSRINNQEDKTSYDKYVLVCKAQITALGININEPEFID